MPYEIQVDDNFHYADSESRTPGPTFESAEEALAYCKSVVDQCLADQYQPGMTAGALYGKYTLFGDDPFILSINSESVEFSAWDYARQRSTEICAGANPIVPS